MKKPLSRLFAKATDGLIGSTVNGVLYFLYLFEASFGKSTSRDMYLMFREADEMFQGCNYQHFKQLLTKLKHQKLIQRNGGDKRHGIHVTSTGQHVITAMIPPYSIHRPWDGCGYIISYDIPEAFRSKRNIFRLFLRKHHCVFLQESIWFTIANPQSLIDTFVEEHHIDGLILVSKLEKTGVCNGESLIEMIRRLYHISELQKEYEGLLADMESKPISYFSIHMRYVRILARDPQLPSDVLPSHWVGDEVYQKIQKLYPNRYAAAQ